MAPDAKREWIAFHDHIEPQMKDGMPLSPVKGFAAKAAEHAGRLAGVLTLVEDHQANEIPLAQMQAGIELMKYYLEEALRLFHSSSDNPDLVLAEKCLVWIGEHGGLFSLPDLYQKGPTGVRTKADALRIIRILEDHGWLRKLENGTKVNGVARQNVWRCVE